MPSKFDRLRAGESVEVEPGRVARLNLQEKMYETSDGKRYYVGDDPDFFPQNNEAVKHSQEKEALTTKINRTPGGEFLHQFFDQGVGGAAKNWYNKLSKSGDDYLRSSKVNQEVSQQISKNSPVTSGAATVASFLPDIALTKGMSAARAAPTLTALHAGPKIIEQPGEVAVNSLIAAGSGYLLDKATNGLSKMAQRRADSRAMPAQQQAVRNANMQGQQNYNTASQNVANANMAAKQKHQQDLLSRQNTIIQNKNSHAQAQAQSDQQHNILVQNVKNTNQQRLQQHKQDLAARENKIIQDRNAYTQAENARKAEVVRLKNQAEADKLQRSANAAKSEAEYQAAKRAADEENKRMTERFKLEKEQYEKSLKEMPELQKRAQAEHAENVVKTAKELERSVPKSARLSTEELRIKDFVEDVHKSGLAGSREASQASRVINAIFPDGEYIGARELSSRYKALEGAIQRAAPEVQEVLVNFKEYLGKRLPLVIEDSVALSKISPIIKRSIDKDIAIALSDLQLGSAAEKVQKLASINAKSALSSLNAGNIVQKIQNGELAKELASKVLTVEDFLVDISAQELKRSSNRTNIGILYDIAQQNHKNFVYNFAKNLENRLAKSELKALEAGREASKNLGKNLRKTYGLADPIPAPKAPQAPNPVAGPVPPGELPPLSQLELPPAVAAPVEPAFPAKPNLLPDLGPAPKLPPPATPQLPQAPTPLAGPSPFVPAAEPTLAAPQNMAERAGDFFEKNLLGGKGIIDNPVAKLAGLKYMLGKAALPLEAGYLAMKGLTSPTAAGNVARMTFKQGGIQAIDAWAQKYPSYHDGILENPQDRRSMTKEIEDDHDIPIEQKAILQSKVNRGRPLDLAL